MGGGVYYSSGVLIQINTHPAHIPDSTILKKKEQTRKYFRQEYMNLNSSTVKKYFKQSP